MALNCLQRNNIRRHTYMQSVAGDADKLNAALAAMAHFRPHGAFE
jgi:hypothetical protein